MVQEALESDLLEPPFALYLESYRKLGSLPASPQVSGVMARVSDKTPDAVGSQEVQTATRIQTMQDLVE